MASVDWAGQISTYLKVTGAPVPGMGDLLAALGGACQKSIERHIGRTFDTQTYTEAYSGNGKSRLFLRHDPIWTLTSVTVAGASKTVQANFATAPTYPLPVVAIDPGQESLILTNGDGWSTVQLLNVMVTYSAGLTGPFDFAPPPDLITAVTLWAANLFRDRDRLGLSSSVIGGQNVGITHEIPPTVMAMANRWRRGFIPA